MKGWSHDIDTIYAFDLDGTVTEEEVLPLLAEELGIREEMERLTAKAVSGEISFKESFRQRFDLLKVIPLDRVHEIMDKVKLNEDIIKFFHTHECALVTGNIDLWIEPIVKKLGCERIFASHAEMKADGVLELSSTVDKRAAVRKLRKLADRVIAVGDSANDIPMFEEAGTGMLYTGVNKNPSEAVRKAAIFRADNSKDLCYLLDYINCPI